MNNKDKDIICSNLVKLTYKEGSHIIKIGDFADCLYIINEGTVDCITADKQVVRTLGKGDHFGFKSLLMQSTRTMNIVAKTKCVCCSISFQSLKLIIGENYKEAIVLSIIKNAFAMSKYLNTINPSLIENFFSNFEIVNFKKNEKILDTGSIIQAKYFVVIEGNIVQVFLD